MILELDVTQMLLAIFFWGPLISITFYYIGKHRIKLDSEQFKMEINRLRTKVEVLQEEKAELIAENREETL